MERVKSVNGLMKYLREKHNMSIKGANDKLKLKNIGYYHGYKGYRYIKVPNNKVSLKNFKELMGIIEFDNNLKAILYPNIMFIETALKSYALEILLSQSKTENLSDIYTKLMINYKSFQSQSDNYKKAYTKRMETYNRIQSNIASSYAANNEIVSHYLKKDESVPVWAIFEIITLGEFGNLISTLDRNTRKSISRDIGLNIAFDSDGKLIENIIFIIKDLRNAIAHNNVIFDTRFRNRNISTTLIKAIENDTKVNSVNFKSITDYIILVSYIAIKLNRNPKYGRKLINEYKNLVNNLKLIVPKYIYDQIVFTNDAQKLESFQKGKIF